MSDETKTDDYLFELAFFMRQQWGSGIIELSGEGVPPEVEDELLRERVSKHIDYKAKRVVKL